MQKKKKMNDNEHNPLLQAHMKDSSSSINTTHPALESPEHNNTNPFQISQRRSGGGKFLHLLKRLKPYDFYFYSFILIFLYIIFDVLSTLYFKKSLNLLYQHPFLASELNYIITSVLFFIGHFIYSEVYFVSKNGRKFKNHHNVFTIHYINISICNIFETLFQIIGSNGMGKSSGSFMVVLAQINIPLSVLFTILIFKFKYNKLQWIGVSLILLGIFIVVILPYLVNRNFGGVNLFYSMIFLLSCLFSVGQRMYEQYLFKFLFRASAEMLKVSLKPMHHPMLL